MTTESDLERYRAECRERVERALEHWLPAGTTPPERLHQAMRYAALGPGKRVRPLLVYAAGRALGADPKPLDAPAAAVELIHAYSLVHDDLPAMDDDELRRGRKTCHVAFDEATAILTGDALQTLAFKILAADGAAEPGVRLEMIRTLALASGSRGMAGGQAMDLEATGRSLDLAELENMHIHKTGALIHASVRLGCLGAGVADPERTRPLEHYAKCIGLAFQVQDDILDVEGDTATLGKTQGKDQASDKATYPALLGLEESRRMARRLCDDARDSLNAFGDAAAPLRWLADYIVERRR